MALAKITQVAGRGVFVPGNDIDTDRIIPARFMKCVSFDGLGEFVFFDVRKNEDGSPVGLYTLDLYTRDSKRGGAWMNSHISQSSLLDHPVVVTNNMNVPKPAAGEPKLAPNPETSVSSRRLNDRSNTWRESGVRVSLPK